MRAESDTLRWMMFDRVEIDVYGHRLFVNGAEVALERKAFAVLVLLAREPGRVFGRDEILDAVWAHRYVSPGVLNRIITVLRHALGESADAHRYLQTVHGVGYRFDAKVRSASAREHVDTTPVQNGTHDDAAALAGAEANANAQATPSALPPANANRRITWAGSALLAILLAGAGLWFYRNGNRTKLPAPRQPTLVVLPLQAVDSEAGEKSLTEGLSEDLITRLARVDGLRLISPTSAEVAEAQKFDLEQLAKRLHVTHALQGSLRQSGQRLRIDLRLIEVPGGRTLWAQNYDRRLADVLAVQTDIARSVASALSLRLRLVKGTVEGDPKRYLEYLRLRRFWIEGYRPGKALKIAALVRSFVAQAPDYAPAHGLRALVLTFLYGFSPPVPASELRQAGPEARRALEMDPDQIDALLASAVLACRATDWEHCMAQFHHAVELFPADSSLRSLYAFSLAGIGYLDAAREQANVAVASDPINYPAKDVLACILDTLGRHQQAHDVYYASASQDLVTPAYHRWNNAIWRRDFAAARRAANGMPAEEHIRDSYLAATDALADPRLWPKAMTLIEANEAATSRYNFLRLAAPNPNIPTAIAALETVLRGGTSLRFMLLWNPETGFLRRDPAFQDFLQRTHIIDYWNAHGWPPQCHPDGSKAVCA